MKFSKAMVEKAKTAASAEELIRMAAEEGVELGAEEAGKCFAFLQSPKALSEEELESISAGKGDTVIYENVTKETVSL